MSRSDVKLQICLRPPTAAALYTFGVVTPTSQVIVHRDLNVLLRTQIALSGLDRRVPEEELDLLEVTAILPAELGASTTEMAAPQEREIYVR